MDVSLPSGNVIQMAKPSQFAVLFKMQNIPSNLTDKSRELWAEEKGIGTDGKTPEERFMEEISDEERDLVIQASLRARDEMIKLSRQPKLVLVKTNEPGTLWVEELEDEDVAFLLRWVSSGGTASVRLENFRKGPEQDTLGEPTSEQVRTEAVGAAGAAK